MKYTEKEYLKYKRGVEKAHKNDGVKPTSYEIWKKVQPIADGVVSKVKKIVNTTI